MNKERFESIAQKYDAPERIQLAQIIAQETNQLLEGSQYRSLLDYGGGTGLVTLNIDHHFEFVTLIDASPNMIDIFRSKVEALGKTSITPFTGDVLSDDTSLVNTTYDVIFLSLVLLHSGDYQALLKKLATHLNDGGQLILVDFDKNERINHPKVYNGFEQSDIRNVLEQSGLTNISTHTFYTGDHIFMNQRASLFIASGMKPNTKA
ncbi:class I SAM-dependent methyltransferase [Staphylococcus caeli]|uniref:Methyltransferase n=1 Tax=Staphylococcus caeli TaxID=2201815 RepID=A0A1D4L736_9STAP|nr:class I SAM-dependent methyltransferase [Staphylococcus caeli]SCS82115.1 methyltransferase [Staphylococcus caeli]SCT00829.1 methyltransferase [Staphylococcus caeli]